MKSYVLAFLFISVASVYAQEEPKKSTPRSEVFHYPYLRLTDRVVQVDTKTGTFSESLGGGRNLAIVLFEEYRILDEAIEQYALDAHLPDGTKVTPSELAIYLPPPGRPYLVVAKSGFIDLSGNPCGEMIVGKPPHVSQATFKNLEHSVPPGFWKHYAPE